METLYELAELSINGTMVGLMYAPIALGIVLEKVLRRRPVAPALLDAFFVVDVHVEVGAALLCQGQTLFVNHGGVFHRRHSGANGVLDSLRRVGMRGYAQPELPRLVHGRLQFFGRELLGIGIAAMREHRAAR